MSIHNTDVTSGTDDHQPSPSTVQSANPWMQLVVHTNQPFPKESRPLSLDPEGDRRQKTKKIPTDDNEKLAKI